MTDDEKLLVPEGSLISNVFTASRESRFRFKAMPLPSRHSVTRGVGGSGGAGKIDRSHRSGWLSAAVIQVTIYISSQRHW